uniref:Choline transporter-like protein n=1 Tax=Sander lucioperca TaxID=283035 RepID=A0A8D0AP27_SANLU
TQSDEYTSISFFVGEPRKFDPTFKGPIQNRGCTDIVCCILFIIAILAYIAVGILGKEPIKPTNTTCFCNLVPSSLVPGRPQEGDLPHRQSRPVLWAGWHATCVSFFPFTHSTFLFILEIINQSLQKNVIMRSHNSMHNQPKSAYLFRGPHFFKYAALSNATVVIEARQVVMKIFEDFTQSWYWILIGLVIAMLTSLLFIVLLRFLAGIMVWVMIVMVILVIGYGIFHCYMEYAALKGTAGSDVTLQQLGFQTDFAVYLQIRQTWLAFMIILAIVEVIIILLLIFLRKRILIAIALIKEASRAIGHVMSSLFYPLFTFVLLAMVVAYWAVTAVFLSTSNEPIYKVFNETACDYSRTTCNPKARCPDSMCLFAFYGGETAYHKYLIGLQFYNVFLFFWCANFVTALGQMTLAGAFASYYWAFVKPDDMPAFPVFSSLGRSLRYHTGTLAFGSLILSIVQIIRVLLEYLDHKLQGAQNKCTKFLLCCMKCCFWCLEKFVKFINRNAYIIVAIYGKNFCTSAREGFFLLMRNMVRFFAAVCQELNIIWSNLSFYGLSSTGIFAFFFFSGRVKAFESTAPHLHYYWVPILTVVVLSYFIAHGFFSVYAMCVDTLFLCFCEDLERNDGSAERPYYMSSTLHEILWKNAAEDPSSARQRADEDIELK